MKTFAFLFAVFLCTGCKSISWNSGASSTQARRNASDRLVHGIGAGLVGLGGGDIVGIHRAQTERQRAEAEQELYRALAEQIRIQNELLKQSLESSAKQSSE